MLNDHPVLLGEHFRSITLWPAGSAPGEHVLDVVADSEWALQFPQSRIDAYKKIVLEERHVFGDVGHYRKYHWLLTLSDNLGSFGVEHHECADDRVAENTFVDDDTAKRSSLLLPHEFFHSWNGKARRPAGLVDRRLREADEGRPAVGLRRAHRVLRRAAGGTRRADFRAGVDGGDGGRRDVGERAGPHVAAAAGHGGLGAVSLPRRRRLVRLAARTTDFYAGGIAHLARGRRHDPAADEREEDAR